MTAAAFEGEGKLVLQQRPVPKIQKPIAVRIEAGVVGVCGTDFHILDVPLAILQRKEWPWAMNLQNGSSKEDLQCVTWSSENMS